MKLIRKSIELFFKGLSFVLCPIIYSVVYIVGLLYYSIIFLFDGSETDVED